MIGDQMMNVYICSGSVKHVLMYEVPESDAWWFCDSNDWSFIDENEFEWDMGYEEA